MSKYLVPLFYTVHSRSPGVHFVSYVLMVFLPPLLQLIFHETELTFQEGILYMIAFLGMLSVYECGYLINDVVCIKNDPQPTHRIPATEQLEIERQLPLIILGKILVCFVITLVLFVFNPTHILLYSICNVLIFVVYIVHNHFRNWIPFITVFILTTLNYFTPLAFFSSLSACKYYLFFILLYFSIPKTIFYVIRKITRQAVKNENVKFFLYYLGASLFTIVLSSMNFTTPKLAVIPLYLSLYRFAIFIVKKLK